MLQICSSKKDICNILQRLHFFGGFYFPPSSLLRWFKEGRLLTDQEKYQTYSEPRSGVVVFVIKNPGEKDLGRYECEVKYCEYHLSHFIKI